MEATCSPEVMRKVVAASTEGRSYQVASTLLRELADLEIPVKQCERISQRIGQERLDERAARLEAYEKLPIPEQQQAPSDAPSNSWDGRVAAVLVDGGRAQVRDERWGQPHSPDESVSWWREPKVACLATFSSHEHSEDPLPEVPACLLDPLWVIPRVKELKRSRSGRSSECDGDTSPAASSTENEVKTHWSPKVLVRSVVATFAPYEELGRLAKVEAYHRGFTAAPRKVFLGDGHLANWGLHERMFFDYTPVTDLMHASSYVYDAALASTPDVASCWSCFKRWITWMWQGNVSQIIEELTPLIEKADEASRETLQISLTYLKNNADRMRYAEYRRAGLPITTTIIESTIKRINRRMKGTEKFWGPGAEPQLQLCADWLSETEPLTAFWQRRQRLQTGYRKSRTKA